MVPAINIPNQHGELEMIPTAIPQVHVHTSNEQVDTIVVRQPLDDNIQVESSTKKKEKEKGKKVTQRTISFVGESSMISGHTERRVVTREIGRW